MKSRSQTISILITACLLLSGCIHTYPEPGRQEDPTLASVTIKIKPAYSWGNIFITHSDENQPPSKSPRDPSKRIILEVVREGSVMAHLEKVIAPDDEEYESGEASFNLKIPPDDYKLAVWCDLLEPGSSKPFGYDASKLSDIRMLLKHGDSGDGHECLSYLGDLRLKATTIDETIEIPINPTPPVGRFRIVADDYSDFLKQNEEAISMGATYYVEATYQSAIPGAFSVIEDSPMRPTDNVTFSRPLEIITIPGIEMGIASDWLFVSEGSDTHTVSLTLFNSAKAVVSKTVKITFQLERGKVTTIHGNFLSNYISGDFVIDNIWEGEEDIEL